MGQRYVELQWKCPDPECNERNFCGFDNNHAESLVWILCTKCPLQYATPDEYSCLQTDFGTIVIKLHNQTVTATEARSLCAADADYVHLPMPQNSIENMWYINYAKKLGVSEFWLGINHATTEGEWRTDNGDLQTFLSWKSGSEVVNTVVGPNNEPLHFSKFRHK